MWLLQCLYSHQEYSSWETDEVIVRELVRNLGIALACVFLTTLLLLANFLGSVIVLLCVAVTLVSRSRWQIRNWTQFDNVYQQGWLVWLHAFLGPHRGRHQCRGYYHSYWALCWLCRCFFFLQTFVVSWIWPEPSHPSAHLPRLLDRVRKQKRESSRGLGWHGPCCPQWRPLNPHRLHPPPQQRLLLFPHLLQDLLPYCTIWGLARPSSSPSPLVFGWTWRLQLCQVQWKKRLFVLVKILYH